MKILIKITFEEKKEAKKLLKRFLYSTLFYRKKFIKEQLQSLTTSVFYMLKPFYLKKVISYFKVRIHIQLAIFLKNRKACKVCDVNQVCIPSIINHMKSTTIPLNMTKDFKYWDLNSINKHGN